MGAWAPAGSAPVLLHVHPVGAPRGLQLTLPPEMELTLIHISYSFEGQTEISSLQTTLLSNNLPTHLPSA